MATALISIGDNVRDRNDLVSLENSMNKLAESNGERIDRWLSGVDIRNTRRQDMLYVIRKMQRGDSLYVEDVSSLGNSVNEVLSVLTEALKFGINVYGVSDGFAFDRGIDRHIYLTAFEQVGDIYYSIISKRTKAALKKKKQEGVKLGRPVGSDEKMRVLQRNRVGIVKAIDSGVPYVDICRKYRVSASTFRRFREAEGLLSSQVPEKMNPTGHQTYITPSAIPAEVMTWDILCQSGKPAGVEKKTEVK